MREAHSMFDRPEEFFESHDLVMRVAVKVKPERRQISGVRPLLMHRLASLRGIGAGTPSGFGMEGADMEVTVWYDEPQVIAALFDDLKAEDDVVSFKVVAH
jgi:hypothetical protein